MEALGHMFVKLGIQFVYYNGSTSQAKKTKALSEFKENPSVQVFVSSTLITRLLQYEANS